MTHAPGYSAYNYVERRMVPLSKDLTGLVLPHDSCGSHFDSSGMTIDKDLEKENFKVAGNILSEIWSELVLDDHPVMAEYVEDATLITEDYEERWVANRYRISQYMLQIVKCADRQCFGDLRTEWRSIFQGGFLPPPVQVSMEGGMHIPKPEDVRKTDKFPNLFKRMLLEALVPKSDYAEMPYDTYLPSIKKDIHRRMSCDVYFPSAAAVKRHVKGGGCKGLDAAEVSDESSESENEDDDVFEVRERRPNFKHF